MEGGLEDLAMRHAARRLLPLRFVPMAVNDLDRVIVESGRGCIGRMMVPRHAGMTRKRRLIPPPGPSSVPS